MVSLTIQKKGLIYRADLLAITLSLVVALGLLLQGLDLPSSLPAILSLYFINNAFADHGEEIILSLNDSSFERSSPEGGNQVKVVVNYETQDPMAVHDLVKGVMKVYTSNGTLIKTSSSPTPFPVSASGKLQLATTLTEESIETVTANVVFTNPIRTEIVSNELPVKLNANRGITSTSLEENQDPADVLQEEQEQQTTLMPTKPPGGTEVQQPAVIPSIPSEAEEITKQLPRPSSQAQEIAPQELQPTARMGPMEPLFQGTPTSAMSSPVEICTDGIDNDADSLTDFEDNNCPVVGSNPEPMNQEQLASATLEVCEDALDNDLDGKIDTADEECLSTSSSATQLAPQEQDSQNGTEEDSNDNDNNAENGGDNDNDEDDGNDEDNGDDDDNNN